MVSINSKKNDILDGFSADVYRTTVPEVVDDIGQVLQEKQEFTFTPVFPKIPWRTVRDNKGFIDGEITTMPSQVDMSDYVDNREVISKLVRNIPEKVLFGMSEAQHEVGDYTSDKVDSFDNYDEHDESEEYLDILTEQSNRFGAEAKAEARPKSNQQSNSETADEVAQANEDKVED